uniref:Uncharacterized protein n=1 Tax=Molossus molossus TaxID=27622 RepID=A0A7J8G0I4_MOLMO|nr:hypothetical protein HJG59_008225 [Molossus molossus]
MRGLHCFNHDGIMLPRKNHKSQNSVGGGGVYSGSGCDWLKELLIIGSRGKNECRDVQSARQLWWRKPLAPRALGSAAESNFLCFWCYVRDVCRARLLPFGRVHCGSIDVLSKGLVATFNS